MKKLLSFILTAVLCLGMATNVYAASPSVDNSAYPAPTEVKWSEDGYWLMQWNNPGHEEACYNVRLLKDGEEYYATTIQWNDATLETYTFSLWEHINDSGTYTFTVAAVDSFQCQASSAVVTSSNSKEYVRPETVLGTVTASWDTEKVGTVNFSGLDSDMVNHYQVRLMRDMGEYSYWAGSEWVYPRYAGNSNVFSVDLSKHILEDGKYFVEVRALSRHIDKAANGEWGPASDVYDTTVTSEAVSGALDAALASGDVDTAVDTLKTDVPVASMRTAMQTDETVLNKVAEIEEAYAAAKGITVSNDVSEDAAKYVDASKISMVGAALNADAGNVSLSLTEPETKIPIPANRYENSVQLDLKLFNDGTSKSELEFPITITMPIPAGVGMDRLTILHYHQDGTQEIIKPRVNADNTLTFTVTKFSTFVFANTFEEEAYDPIPGAPGDASSEVAGSQEIDFAAEDGTAMRWITSEQNDKISVSGTQANIPAGAVFNASKITSGEEAERVAKAVASTKGEVQYVAYDFTLETEGGQPITKFNGHVDVSMLIPHTFTINEGEVVSVYYLTDAGKLQRCNSIMDESFVTFGTTHFSTFVYIVESAASAAASPVVTGTAATTSTAATATSPKTADMDMTLYMSMLAVVAMGVAVYGTRKVKYNR